MSINYHCMITVIYHLSFPLLFYWTKTFYKLLSCTQNKKKLLLEYLKKTCKFQREELHILHFAHLFAYFRSLHERWSTNDTATKINNLFNWNRNIFPSYFLIVFYSKVMNHCMNVFAWMTTKITMVFLILTTCILFMIP